VFREKSKEFFKIRSANWIFDGGLGSMEKRSFEAWQVRASFESKKNKSFFSAHIVNIK